MKRTKPVVRKTTAMRVRIVHKGNATVIESTREAYGAMKYKAQK